MATDLSDLSELEPAGTDLVSSGDDEIRKGRLHTKNWAGVEHHLTGEHKIPSGGVQPTPGFAGKLFIDTAIKALYRDNGAAWTMVNTVPFASAETPSSIAINDTAPVVIQSFNMFVPVGAQSLIVAGIGNFVSINGDFPRIDTTIKFNGGAISSRAHSVVVIVQPNTFVDVGIALAPAQGIRAVSWEAKIVAAGTPPFTGSVSSRTLFAIAV